MFQALIKQTTASWMDKKASGFCYTKDQKTGSLKSDLNIE